MLYKLLFVILTRGFLALCVHGEQKANIMPIPRGKVAKGNMASK